MKHKDGTTYEVLFFIQGSFNEFTLQEGFLNN